MAKDGFPKNKKDNSKRRYPGEGGPRPDHAQYKRDDAATKNAAWRKLTPQQQLKALDERLGKNQGAVKQRGRLFDIIMRQQKAADAEKAARDAKAQRKTK